MALAADEKFVRNMAGQLGADLQDRLCRIGCRFPVCAVQHIQKPCDGLGPCFQTIAGGGYGGGAEIEDWVEISQIEVVDFFPSFQKFLILPVFIDPCGIRNGAQSGNDIADIQIDQFYGIIAAAVCLDQMANGRMEPGGVTSGSDACP